MSDIKVVTKFVDKATVKIFGYIYNEDGDLADPTSVKVDLYDPDGTQKLDLASTTKSSTGIYYYLYNKGSDFTAMDAGRWRGTVWAYDGSGTGEVHSPGNFSFTVE
jgi:hypothetical protein